jgi:4-hydroxy-tetrahydrodipicolinate synthase
VARATELPVLCYNNPVSYGVDITPEMFAALADEPTLVAIKESSENVRRITDLRNLVGDRYTLFEGVDDLALEGALLGATGWVSGLANAFPIESVRLWELAQAGQLQQAVELYRWYTPLLHLDTRPKLVQCIKLVNALVGVGNEAVRAPRLTLAGAEREEIVALVEHALKTRPSFVNR